MGRGRGPIVDVTAASENVISRVHCCCVYDEAESGSNHPYVSFGMRDRRTFEACNKDGPRYWRTGGGINAQEMEVELLLAQWTGNPEFLSESANANQRVNVVQDLISAACDIILERKAPIRPGKPPVHWWNAEIARKLEVCINTRRRKTRSSARLHRLRNRIWT